MSLEHALGHLRADQPEQASRLLRAHLEGQPDDPQAWFLLGVCRNALKDLRGAAEAFGRSVVLDPARLEAHLSCIFIARAAGDATSALAACERALQQFPSEAKLHYAAALALEDLGRSDEALRRYEQALAHDPRLEDALFNRGLLLARMQRLEEAETTLLHCIDAHPSSIRALGALVDVLLAGGNYERATEAAEASLRCHPVDAPMLVRKALALASLRRFEEARGALSEARRCSSAAVAAFAARVAPGPDLDAVLSPENIFMERCYAALCQCDWSRWEPMIDESRRLASQADVALEPSVGFMIRFLPLSETERHAVLRKIALRLESQVEVMPAPPPRQAPRIRVGVLSPDFREHLNAYLLLPLFELMDRQRFEIYAYSLSADDRSPARARIRAAADVFRDLHASTDEEAASVIRRDDIDILVDVGGHTTGGRFRIVARRPARLQVNYLGFSCSLGSGRVDYAIVDRVAAPSEVGWTEALAYVPSTCFLYDYRQHPAEVPLSRRDYGLPEDAFVFCAFHRAEKITPDIFDTWMQILTRTPSSVMWLHAQVPIAVRNLRQQARLRGIDPSRLIFAPFEPRTDPRYPVRQRLGDLFIDSPHHNATTTACDALGVGLPLLTLSGKAFSARVAASLLHAAGLPQLVTNNTTDFMDLAVRLAHEPGLLRDYRDRLTRNRLTAPLFDTLGRVRALQVAFEQMWSRLCNGEPPKSFDIEV